MTKASELSIVDEAIHQLGKDTYLGPWLREVRAVLEADIRSDIFPTISLVDAKKQAADIVAEAQLKAEEIIQAAKAKAESIEKQADKHWTSVAAAIRDANHALNRF